MTNREIRCVTYTFSESVLRIQTVRDTEVESATGILEFQVVTASIIRVRYTEKPNFTDVSSPSLLPLPTCVETTCEDLHDQLILKTEHLMVRVSKENCRIAYYDQEGTLLLEESAEQSKSLLEKDIGVIKYPPGAKISDDHSVDGLKQKIEGGEWVFDRRAYESKLRFSLQENEGVYGLGQHENGTYNYRGKSEHLYQANMKVAIPVMVSSNGYAIYLDQHCYSVFESDDESVSWWSEAVEQLDYFFVYGPQFDDIVSGLRSLTGGLPMLPRWSYGFVQSKECYETQEELISVIDEYRRRKVPIDCIIQDWKSWEGDLWGQKTFDPVRFHDPSKMMQDLHERNVRLLLSVWPNMKEGGENHAEFKEADLLYANNVTYDAMQPEATAVYWQQMRDGLFQYGVDGWWCDCTEPFSADWSGSFHAPDWKRAIMNTNEFKKFMDPADINAYSLLHAEGIYKGQRGETVEKRVINLTRSSAPSQQRYGTIVWSGDIEARWSRLCKQIADGLNFTVTGNPRWTFDIGGFFVKPGIQWFWDGEYPDGTEDEGYRELYTRWYQVGCFLPMFRSHGTDAAREIWRFGEEGTPYYDTIKKFTELRYRFLPYIYSLAAQEVFHGYTMFRSLMFDFNHDETCRDISDQFMFGPSLLVCPVLEPMYFGAHSTPIENKPKTRRLYLPEGTEWYDFWDNRKYTGGQWIESEAPLEKMPLFVKAGSILPLAPSVQHSAMVWESVWEFHVYAGRDGYFEIYEDAGDGYAYEEGEYCWTPVHWDNSLQSLEIGKPEGEFDSFLKHMEFIQVLHGFQM